ncbi:IPT/TIG domain-containing protein [Actinoplanes sp. NPDC026623]|uniref:IPT/TIG domain-containing protein n=1 Tax=Actinoplanes sp. NPDC026623 TaxID=3155610 RepID=UPI0033CB344E
MKVRAHKAVIAAAAVAAGASIFGMSGAASAAGASLLPTVTKLNVAKGSTAGGTVVTITGTNFDTATGVKVGGTAATPFLIATPTMIVAKVAAGTGSKVQVEVTNPTGASVNTVADDFTFLAPMDSVAATALLNPFGKSTITVTTTGAGTSADLFKANKVTATVNGTSSPVTWVSDTSVKVAAPAGDPSATAASVVLYHDGVAGAADTTHAKYAAVITKLSKTSGSTAGGGTIAISGKGLSTATAFNFGATAATACAPVALKTDTDWTCTIPAVAAGGVAVKAVLPTISYGVLPTSAYTFSDVS